MSFDHLLGSLINSNLTSQVLTGLTPSSAAYLLARFFQKTQKTLALIAPTTTEAELLREDLNFFLGKQAPVLYFPNLDVLPYFQLSPHPDLLTERLGCLFEMSSSRKPAVIISSHSATLRRLPPKTIFQTYTDYLVSKEEIDREQFLSKLVEAGYLSVPLVEDAGTFSVRGGILDVFPPHSQYPYRVELFGDLVESIRLFEPSTQRSLQEVEELVLLPSREVILNEKTIALAISRLRPVFDDWGLSKSEREEILTPLKNRLPFPGLESFLPYFYDQTASFYDYLKPDASVFYLDPEAASPHETKLKEELVDARQHATSPERIVPVDAMYFSSEELLQKSKSFRCFTLEAFLSPSSEKTISVFKTETNEILRTKILPPSSGGKMLEPLALHFREQIELGSRLILVAGSESQYLRLKDLLSRLDLNLHETALAPISLLSSDPGRIYLTQGHLSQGFQIAGDGFYFVTDEEIFGSKTRRIRKAPTVSTIFNTFEDLKAGDTIVHQDHGIGLFKGLTALKLGEVGGEFLLLEYLGGDKLYLPVYRLHLIQRYSGDEGYVPELDRLGGTQWLKTQEKVKKTVRTIAGEILKVCAARATERRVPYSMTMDLFEEFEATFPYEETIDQENAIHDVLKDLEKDRPMDRLVCGDVGFGKTEVALRAAFIAAMDGKQVAVLVPTTILAFQHFETFQKRLKHFGLKVEMLSRFRNPKEQKEIIDRLGKGEIDVVVGTHRLLQARMPFKNLGLLVIDEEHRFGVIQKEKIKKLKNRVDVLTLTATPIPRTLNISLFGIRDLSVINTPPPDRMAVRTYVAHFDETLIRDAILREFHRGGQVFFVHNRVQTIQEMVNRLRLLVPEANISVAHGQMEDEELEEAMLQFLQKKSNLLLSTAIVESGLDFPSANTILINRADTFGLAQLYQLRGRVGRSNLRAFCYLLTPPEVAITPEARTRLNVLQRFTELGSGFKIAAHDMEIRGAGNLLGVQQHGNITAVGYEMYLRLLEQAIQELKGEIKEIEVDPELNFKVPASLPETYVPEPSLRLGLYKRISQATDAQGLDELKEEINDRFGPLPDPANHLLMLMRIRLLAKRLLIESIHQEQARMIYKFHPKTALSPEILLKKMKKDPKNYQLTQDFKWITPQKESFPEKILEQVWQLLSELDAQISG